MIRPCLRAGFCREPQHPQAELMRKELGTFILLVVLCVVLAILTPSFLSPDNLQNLARLIGIYGIFSIGIGVVIITGGIDLSVGSIFALLRVVLLIFVVLYRLPA